MYREKNISLVIPCFNEEKGLAQVLYNVPSYIDEVVIGDNNSTDNTSSVAKKEEAKVVFEPKRGYGNALRAGFSKARGDIIATLDGDGTYPIKEISRLVDILIDEGLDFISGARFPLKDRKAMNLRNLIGNKILTFTFRLFFISDMLDSQSGMWIFKREILKIINPSSPGMSFSEEIKIETFTNPKIKAKEIWIPYNVRMGRSKLHPWKDGFNNLIFLFRKKFKKNEKGIF